MNKKLRLVGTICIVILIAAVLSISKAALPGTSAPLSVQVEQGQVGVHIVSQSPVAGQRLMLSPVIQVTFDRDMDAREDIAGFLADRPRQGSDPRQS